MVMNRDGDAKILCRGAWRKFGKNRERIRHSAAVDAGVQVALRAGQLDLVVVQATHP